MDWHLHYDSGVRTHEQDDDQLSAMGGHYQQQHV
jgi:hypothetical protein